MDTLKQWRKDMEELGSAMAQVALWNSKASDIILRMGAAVEPSASPDPAAQAVHEAYAQPETTPKPTPDHAHEVGSCWCDGPNVGPKFGVPAAAEPAPEPAPPATPKRREEQPRTAADWANDAGAWKAYVKLTKDAKHALFGWSDEDLLRMRRDFILWSKPDDLRSRWGQAFAKFCLGTVV